MAFLILLFLVFIGSLSTALSVEIVTKQSEEHLIALRDYDFVGEDKRLSTVLAERLAVLQTPLNLSDVAARLAPPRGAAGDAAPRPAPPARPDLLHLNLRRYPRVNVSLDYAELFHDPDLSIEVNASWPPPSASSIDSSKLAQRQAGNLTAGRRAPTFWDPTYRQYSLKILDIMRQNVYAVQGKLIEIEPIIQKYQGDPRFRIAYIYSRLDEWKKDLRTLYFAMKKYRWVHLRFKRIIWYYEHALRRNIDITYSIEFLLHLHTEYMKKMEEIMPASQRAELIAAQKEREKMKAMQAGMNPSQGFDPKFNLFPSGR